MGGQSLKERETCLYTSLNANTDFLKDCSLTPGASHPPHRQIFALSPVHTLAQPRKSVDKKIREKKVKPVRYKELRSETPIITSKPVLPEKPVKTAAETLKARAAAKYFSTVLFKQMLFLPDLKESTIKSYRMAATCCEKLQQVGEKITSRYCNNRLCLVCNRIRTAKAINGYMEPISQMRGKFFVTLTIPNVPGCLLRDYYKLMNKELKRIRDVWRKINGEEISGIKKFEVTYNAFRDDYHPHFHLIVDSRIAALFIKQEWLQRFPMAVNKAQDIREANEGSLLELFKYSTKLINSFKESWIKTKDGKWKKKKSERAIYVHALNIIWHELHGLRIFQPFGYVKKLAPEISEDIEEIQSIALEGLNPDDVKEWVYYEPDATWIDGESGEVLIDYKKPDNLLKLFRPPRAPD